MEISKKHIGMRIKSIREGKKLTQEKLSEKADLNPIYLSNIERGKSNPTLDLLIRIAKALEVELWELFDYGHEVSQRELREFLGKLAKEGDEEKLRLAVKVLRAVLR